MLDGIEKLLFILKKTGKNYDLDKINAAYLFAKEVHEGLRTARVSPWISFAVNSAIRSPILWTG